MGNAQQYDSNYVEEMMAASLTLKRGYLVSYRSGYIVEAADTSGDRIAGVVRTQEVVSDSSRNYSDSKYGDTNEQAYVEVQKGQGPYLMKLDHTSGTIYIGEKVYAKDGSVPSVQSATDATNDVYVGVIECFVTSEHNPTPTEAAYATSDTWCFVRLDITD